MAGSTKNILHAIILGAPASGKGTISERLVKHFGFQHLACGDLLRQNQQQGTALGLAAAKYIAGGQLVPDALVTECVLHKVTDIPETVSWLLDGFPRTVQQVQIKRNDEQRARLSDPSSINRRNLLHPPPPPRRTPCGTSTTPCMSC